MHAAHSAALEHTRHWSTEQAAGVVPGVCENAFIKCSCQARMLLWMRHANNDERAGADGHTHATCRLQVTDCL